jgi:glycosyltransferase involved in cell wall biosynthesis
VLIGAGDGVLEARLRTLAADLGIGRRVSFCGAQADVLPFYHAADAFTLTSWSEALPLSALEAMGTGLPCVLTDVGGARDIIREGENGYLVSPNSPRDIADGWLKVLLNQDRFRPKEVRKTVLERFTITRCLAGYERLLAAPWAGGWDKDAGRAAASAEVTASLGP